MSDYEEIYYVRLLDDLHNYFPAILYQPQRFQNVQDLLQYITSQTQHRFNLFDRGLRSFEATQSTSQNNSIPTTSARSSIPRSTTQMNIITETFDLSPLLSVPLTPAVTGTQGLSSLQNLLNLLRPPPMDPVVVAPTAEQLTNSTSVRQAMEEQDGDAICSICQDGYSEGEEIREISHCHHFFHKTCIDPWFRQHVDCPVCRFDIRESRNE
jgi:hypothetical protein